MPPFQILFIFYGATVALSATQATEPQAVLFYLWQLLRMYLVFHVVSELCRNERFMPVLFLGIALGLSCEALVVSWQKIAGGQLQPPGTFIHQNSLGLVTNLLAIAGFATMLSELSAIGSGLTVISGVTIAALTASRATIVLAVLGYLLVFLHSIMVSWSTRKASIGLVGALAVALLVPFAAPALEERLEMLAFSNYDERAAYERAASQIVSDFPLGVGANNFSYFAYTDGYLGRANVATNDIVASPHVHNIYWLSAAETGLIGLISLIILLIWPVLIAFWLGLRHRDDPRASILVGLGVSLLAFCVHGYYEWVFFTYPIQYVVAIILGLIAGYAQLLREKDTANRKHGNNRFHKLRESRSRA